MKNVMMVVMLIVVGVFSGCGKDNRSLDKGEIKDIWSQVSDDDYIRVRGIGVAPSGVRGQTHKRGLSRNSALVAARYEALALIKGVTVRGGLTIGKLMEKDSRISEIANRIILGFEEVQTEWTKDDGCVVLLELERDRLETILSESGVFESPVSYRASLSKSPISRAVTKVKKIGSGLHLPGME